MIEKDLYSILVKAEIEINEKDKTTKMPIQIAFAFLKDLTDLAPDETSAFVSALRDQVIHHRYASKIKSNHLYCIDL